MRVYAFLALNKKNGTLELVRQGSFYKSPLSRNSISSEYTMKPMSAKELRFLLFYTIANMPEDMSMTALLLCAERIKPSRELVIEAKVAEEVLNTLTREGNITYVTRRSGPDTERYYRISSPKGRIAYGVMVKERREEDFQRAACNVMVRAINAQCAHHK